MQWQLGVGDALGSRSGEQRHRHTGVDASVCLSALRVAVALRRRRHLLGSLLLQLCGVLHHALYRRLHVGLKAAHQRRKAGRIRVLDAVQRLCSGLVGGRGEGGVGIRRQTGTAGSRNAVNNLLAGVASRKPHGSTAPRCALCALPSRPVTPETSRQ